MEFVLFFVVYLGHHWNSQVKCSLFLYLVIACDGDDDSDDDDTERLPEPADPAPNASNISCSRDESLDEDIFKGIFGEGPPRTTRQVRLVTRSPSSQPFASNHVLASARDMPGNSAE